MTSLVAWSSADQRGPASLNIATDSRISWGTSHQWDQAKKVFASTSRPLLIGFVGDVLFPTLSIPTIIDRIDRGMYDEKHSLRRAAISGIRGLWQDYPDRERRLQKILIAERSGEKMQSKFRLTVMSHAGGLKSPWAVEEIAVPERSTCFVIEGSGAPSVRDTLRLWQKSAAKGTSRAIFSALVESVIKGSDPHSGGAPQLGSLYRIGSGRLLGIVHDDQRYFAGSRLLGNETNLEAEWRNSLFEITDGTRKTRMRGAQRHLAR